MYKTVRRYTYTHVCACVRLDIYVFVPDRRCRILKSRLSKALVTWVLGIWRGEGWGKGWERGGQFTSNLRPRLTDPVTARRVPSKWKGVRKGSKGTLLYISLVYLCCCTVQHLPAYLCCCTTVSTSLSLLLYSTLSTCLSLLLYCIESAC
jgi:hypothetical protein